MMLLRSLFLLLCGSSFLTSVVAAADAKIGLRRQLDDSDQCSLCKDGSVPKNPSQGVVVSHDTFSFSGSCLQLFYKIQSITDDHQMCKVTQWRFDWDCGCNEDWDESEKDSSGWGTWSVNGQDTSGANSRQGVEFLPRMLTVASVILLVV